MQRTVAFSLLLLLAATAAPGALGFVHAGPVNCRSASARAAVSTSTAAGKRRRSQGLRMARVVDHACMRTCISNDGSTASLQTSTTAARGDSSSDGTAMSALSRGDLLQGLGATAVLSLLRWVGRFAQPDVSTKIQNGSRAVEF